MESISKTFLIILVSLLVESASLLAQDTTGRRPLITEKGFLIGTGYGIDSLNVPEGKYYPLFFIGHIGLDLKRNNLSPRKRRGIFTLYFEPQINPVFLKKEEKITNDLEFGINIGFKHMFPLSKWLYTYILISAGPHYTTVDTRRQARGFLFSDNFGTGIYIITGKSVALNMGFRLRHLSNAELKFPNHGINTFNFHLGFSKIIL